MYARVLARNFATSASKPNRETTFKRVWLNVPSAWPVFIVTIGGLALSSYKVVQTLSGPDYHFNKHERSTIDYVENNRDPKLAESWGNSALHRGPDFIREKMIKKE